MKALTTLLAALVLWAGVASEHVFAGERDPLFVNMTTDEAHRANMAISFGKAQMERGHPLTIFLNDKGVFVGAKAHAAKYGQHQKVLGELMGKGATVIACLMCMKHYGIETADLLPGILVGKPELTGGALFKDDTKTMSW
ncbi:MAG: DsrE family protein [Candidatus Competibacteraceae bacterium]|nr:DsrE family protein [Candidatus Competibacteraceae bacterium]